MKLGSVRAEPALIFLKNFQKFEAWGRMAKFWQIFKKFVKIKSLGAGS